MRLLIIDDDRELCALLGEFLARENLQADLKSRIPIPYAWTRGSRFIVYWEDSDFSASIMADGLALFRVPATGGPSEALGVTTLVHQDLLSLSPMENKLWIADASGATSPRQITSDNRYRDEEPLWAADGRHILFGRLDASGTGTLWFMGAGGENPVQVSDALSLKNGWIGYYGYIDWRDTFDWHRS